MSLSFSAEIPDGEWGCSFQEVANSLGVSNINICFVRISNLLNFATELSNWVYDTSWMMNLDYGIRRQYDFTVNQTAKLLIEIFKKTSEDGTIGSEFGELMVSIGSARALEKIFSHVKVPLAELWKPQAKQNEGFDFHTVCTNDFINFGEAKYSSTGNPHGLAIDQAARFLSEQKHLRDRGHLVNFTKPASIGNLDEDKFGVVAAFSINSKNPLLVFKNAITSVTEVISSHKISNFYLIGIVD